MILKYVGGKSYDICSFFLNEFLLVLFLLKFIYVRIYIYSFLRREERESKCDRILTVGEEFM